MYRGQESGVIGYVTKYRNILSRKYSVNLFDKSSCILSPNKLELAMEVQQNPSSDGLEWISLTSKEEIIKRLEELVRSLRKKRNKQ